MQDVADDRDFQPRDPTFIVTDGQRVEEGLRRVFMRAVARVDHCGMDDFCDLMRRAGGGMTDDNRVGRHRLQVQRRVDQSLALDYAGGRSRDIDRVGGQTLRRDFETRAGARGRLEEEIDHGLPAQRRDFFDLSLIYIAESFGGVEDEIDLLRREVFDS